jgi:hypothetical protein
MYIIGSDKPYFDDEIIVPATITEDIFHYAVHEGLAYQTSHHVDVANGATMSISFKTPNTDMQLHTLVSFWSEGEAIFKIREAPTMDTDGTIHPANNRWRAGTPNTTTVLDNSTGSWVAGNCTIDATVLAGGNIINGGGEGEQIGVGKFSGGSVDAAHEWVLESDTEYCFEFLNGTVLANEMSIGLSWFEVPNAQ